MDKNRTQNKNNKNNNQSQKRNDHRQDQKQARPEARIQAKALEASQIRNLIRNNGKLAIGECEYTLRQSSSNNAQLHDIVRDPAFSARQAEPLRNAAESKYELRSNNITAQITIDCKRNTRT